MIDVWLGIALVVIGFILGGMAAMSRVPTAWIGEDEVIRLRLALCTARCRARVIVAMIQDEEYVTARHCAESMYELGEDG